MTETGTYKMASGTWGQTVFHTHTCALHKHTSLATGLTSYRSHIFLIQKDIKIVQQPNYPVYA